MDPSSQLCQFGPLWKEKGWQHRGPSDLHLVGRHVQGEEATLMAEGSRKTASSLRETAAPSLDGPYFVHLKPYLCGGVGFFSVELLHPEEKAVLSKKECEGVRPLKASVGPSHSTSQHTCLWASAGGA